jgi:hypothetical protein
VALVLEDIFSPADPFTVGQRRWYSRLASLFSSLSGSLRVGPMKASRLPFSISLSFLSYLSFAFLPLSLLLPVGAR